MERKWSWIGGRLPVPVEAEDGGNGADGEGFEEKRGEHEEHGGDKRNR